jgi:hypothetical protein
MILYFLFTLTLTVGLSLVSYRFFSQQVEQFQLKLDDGRGYFLISMLLIAFFCSVIAFYLGGLLGYNENPEQQGRMVVAILLNAVVALLSLTFGLLNFKEGERY